MKPFSSPILVTRPVLPPLAEYTKGLEEIWSNEWLTNNGPVVVRFKKRLAEALGTDKTNLSLFNNGTLALEILFHALELSGGEVVTTPFTFVATSHALRRIGAKPVFADIDPDTMCLSPAAAEAKITPRTKAIVPVHVYGHPCDVEGFARLSEKHGIPVLYDAAHAFGVKLGGKDISAFGDASMFSFHSTKLFHSIEGGLLAYKNPALQHRVDELRNFAIHGEFECTDVGTNAKMNEMQALMGLLNLRILPDLIAKRKAIFETYRAAFADSGDVFMPEPSERVSGMPVENNYAYCPVFFKDFETRERVCERLKEFNVFTRRYFYPLLTDFVPYRKDQGSCPVAEDAARRVLTLPTFHALALADARTVAEMTLEIAREKH